jgi:hypothetical protein
MQAFGILRATSALSSRAWSTSTCRQCPSATGDVAAADVAAAAATPAPSEGAFCGGGGVRASDREGESERREGGETPRERAKGGRRERAEEG